MTEAPHLTLVPPPDEDTRKPVEVRSLWDRQAATQPMSMATAQFYVEYTQGAFRIIERDGEFFLAVPMPADLRIAGPDEEFPPASGSPAG